MVVWDRPRGFRSQGCFFVSPRWGMSKIAFCTQFDDIRQFGFLRCLEKPTQNSGMKPTSWNSIPTVFFRFAPMGKIEKRVLNSILTIFVNSAFCAAWKSPPKIVVWNRPRAIRIPTVFFRFAPMGKIEKRVLNSIWRYSSIRLLRCLEKATQNSGIKPTSCNSLPRVFFFCFAPMGKVEKLVLNSIWRYSSIRLFALLGKTHQKWWYETALMDFDPKGVFSFRPDGECRKTRFVLNLTIFVNSAFFAAWKSPPKMVVETALVDFDPNGVFSFCPDGECRKTRLELNLTIFVNSAFCAAWKSPPEIVVWNRPRGFRSLRFFFRFAPMGKVEKRVLN